MLTTRALSASAPMTDPSGVVLSNVQITFTLVDVMMRPTSVWDAASGELVVGAPSVITDVNGLFSLNLWPTARGNVPCLYLCQVNHASIAPFAFSISDLATPLSWVDAMASGQALSPQQLQFYDAITAAAQASATAAANSASTAASSEIAAATSATSAANSATAAGSSATAAGASETAASASQSAAATSAAAAAGSATGAATSATAAASSATAALSSQNAAGLSASNAATSASQAASSASGAATSEAAVNAVMASFNALYLGKKATDPTLDNNGQPLVIGAEYFNTPSSILRVYTSTGWQNVDAAAALDATNAALSASQAASSATSAAGSATSAANSAAAAAGSATSASSSAAAAAGSATNAASSATSAGTSASNAASSATSAASSAAAAAVSAAHAMVPSQALNTNYTLVATDMGTLIMFTGPVTVTFPTPTPTFASAVPVIIANINLPAVTLAGLPASLGILSLEYGEVAAFLCDGTNWHQLGSDPQYRSDLLKGSGSGVTAITLTMDGNAVSANNQIVPLANSSFYLTGSAIVRQASSATQNQVACAIDFWAAGYIGSTPGSIVIVSSGAANQTATTGWTVNVAADTTNGAIQVAFSSGSTALAAYTTVTATCGTRMTQ